ncbi:MAG: dienelactone hydrolase family protein [Acidimicrobiales bacterium]|jgi:carboxymethylenebutenolidase
MYTGLIAEEVRITGHGGDEINAYLARPLGPGPFPGVAVIHHMPGFDEATTEITRKFAAHGYLAIMPNLHYREGPEASPDDAAAASRSAGGVPDDRFLGDLTGAIEHLRSFEEFNGKVGVIGYCSGGRQSFLAACSLEVDAAVDCYGAFVVGDPPEGMPLKVTSVVHLAEHLHCPVLGLFGNEDKFPTPEDVDALEAELQRVGAVYEFHRYDNAGHGFFAVDRTMYRPEAAVDGWNRIFDFYGRHLAGSGEVSS